jgi:hypothetical protein
VSAGVNNNKLDPNDSCCSWHSDFQKPKGHAVPWSIAWHHSNPYCSEHLTTLSISAHVAISVVNQHLNGGVVKEFRNVEPRKWVYSPSDRSAVGVAATPVNTKFLDAGPFHSRRCACEYSLHNKEFSQLLLLCCICCFSASASLCAMTALMPSMCDAERVPIVDFKV